MSDSPYVWLEYGDKWFAAERETGRILAKVTRFPVEEFRGAFYRAYIFTVGGLGSYIELSKAVDAVEKALANPPKTGKKK